MLRWTIQETFDFADGKEFGDVGAYRMLKGEAVVFVDPASIPESAIDDLDKAPLEDGRIRVRTDLHILTPADFARGSRRMMYDFGNRGNKRALRAYNDGVISNDPRTAAHAGNGFLMRHGYTIVWVAWQGDILRGDDRMVLDLPVATDNGEPIVGTVHSDILQDIAGKAINSMPLSGRTNTRSHPAVASDAKALLTRRRYPQDTPIPIPADEWMFAREDFGPGPNSPGGASAIVPSAADIYLKGGFQPGWIYHLSYQGRDPLILGLGHAVVRDVVSSLKHRDIDDFGNLNPATGGKGRFLRSHAIGVSQTGRTMRDYVYRGFNADAEGRKVFDGMLIHVSGAGRLNGTRFGNYTQGGSAQMEDRVFEVDQFPFAYVPLRDPATGRTDSILRDPSTDPLVFSTHTSTEYWQRRGSLLHTDCEGQDLPQGENVRVYHFAGAQHMSFPELRMPPVPEPAHHPENPLSVAALFRAHLVAIDDWAAGLSEPPSDCVPQCEAGTLVSFEAWRESFPRIPGAMIPSGPNTLTSQGSGRAAPVSYPVLVPLCDETGNEIAGIKMPLVAAPLATYAGWNVRKRGYGHGAMFSMFGSFLPLPRTVREAEMSNDPRPAIESLYASRDAYCAAVRAAAEELVQQRHMLEEDVARVEEAAGRWWKIVLE